MKKLLMAAILIFFIRSLQAQTIDEWFNQKKTQKKYLVQQIAALHMYAGCLSNGYVIAKKGLNAIQDIKLGDMALHADHIASLSQVNPKIKRYAKIISIISLEVNITKQVRSAIRRFSNERAFTVGEVGYLREVFNNIITSCAGNIEELCNIITNGNLRIKDDERIEAINTIYDDMLSLQMFTKSFGLNAAGLSWHRLHDAADIIITKKLNAIQ